MSAGDVEETRNERRPLDRDEDDGLANLTDLPVELMHRAAVRWLDLGRALELARGHFACEASSGRERKGVEW